MRHFKDLLNVWVAFLHRLGSSSQGLYSDTPDLLLSDLPKNSLVCRKVAGVDGEQPQTGSEPILTRRRLLSFALRAVSGPGQGP